MPNQTNLKIVFVGDGGVGKTSFISKLIDDSWTPKYTPTHGVQVRQHGNMTLWDVAGQEKFSLNYPVIFEGADKIIFCYDSSSVRSFKSYNGWEKHFPQNISVSFMRMKCDIPNKHDHELGIPTSSK